VSDFVGYGILAVFAGSVAVGGARKLLERRRARRELREKPPLGASSREGEVVRVTGVVRVLDETLEAPLTGRSCVVARSRVVSGTKLTSRAQRPKESMAMVPFIVDRGADGLVVIEGKHVLLDLSPLPVKRDALDEHRRRQFLLLHGLSVKETSRAIFEETLVEPGARVSVAGLMMKDLPTEPVPEELGFRETAPPNLRVAGNVEHPLVIGEPVD
jgi:hypothetical protein